MGWVPSKSQKKLNLNLLQVLTCKLGCNLPKTLVTTFLPSSLLRDWGWLVPYKFWSQLTTKLDNCSLGAPVLDWPTEHSKTHKTNILKWVFASSGLPGREELQSSFWGWWWMMMTHVIANVIPSYYTGVSSSLSLSLSLSLG